MSGSGADTISAGNGNDTISGGQGNDLLTGDIGSDRFIIQTDATLNGLDIITDFNISASDNIFIDFGKINGLTNQASLRGSGSFFQRAAEGSLIGANTGLIIGSVNISNLAEAKVYAEGLAGEAGGDIVYLIGSANAAANGEATLYRVDYTAPNAANVTALASLGNIAIANLTSNNLPQFAPATTQVNFTQRLIQPGNRVKLGAYWPNADGQFGTIAGYDQITDFNATDGTKQILQLPGIAYIAPEVTNFDGLDSALTFNGNANWRHSVSSVGKFTGSHPIQGDNHVAMMIDYLSINDIGNAGATVFFTADYGTAVRGSASHTWIYTQTSNSRGKNPVVTGDATSQNVYDGGYTVVNLIGTTLQGLETIPSGNNNFAIISFHRTGDLASLSGLTDTGNPYTIAVDNAAGASLNAADLSSLGGKTTGTVTVSNAVTITGTAAEVTAALVTENSRVIASTAKVTVTDAISVSAVNAIAAKTSSAVTATLVTGNLASFSALEETSNVYTVTINDVTDTVLTATALSALGAKTTGTVTVSNAVVISGTAAEVTAALVTADTRVVAANAKVTITDTISQADLDAIQTKTNGAVTAPNNSLTFNAGPGAQAFVGGNVNDTFNVTNTVNDGNDTIDGAGGIDQIVIAAGNAIVFAQANNNIQNVENIILGSGSSVTLTGQLEGFTITGSGGNESIVAGSGNDTITGGVGNDQINVGTGTDQIRYAESGAGNVDIVTGFAFGADLVGYSSGNIANGGTNQTLSTLGGTDLGAGGFSMIFALPGFFIGASTDFTFIFLAHTTGNTFANAIAGTTISAFGLDAGLTANKAVGASFYDAGAGQAVFGYILNNSAWVGENAINSGDTFVEMTRITMLASDYTIDNARLSLFAF